MKANNWSEYELAKRSGIHRSTIAGIVRGKNSPRVDTLYEICKAFNITLSEFVDENERDADIDNIISKYKKLDSKRKLAIRNIFELLD